jgi:hypothetical protein
MLKKDLFLLHETLTNLSKIKSTKFGYFILKNLKAIEPEINILRKMGETSDGLKEYERKRVAICCELAEKNEDGTPKTENNQYVIADMKALNEQLTELRNEHKEDFDAEEVKLKELNTILQEKITLDLYKIQLDNIPDGLSAEDLLVLDDLIE